MRREPEKLSRLEKQQTQLIYGVWNRTLVIAITTAPILPLYLENITVLFGTYISMIASTENACKAHAENRLAAVVVTDGTGEELITLIERK